MPDEAWRAREDLRRELEARLQRHTDDIGKILSNHQDDLAEYKREFAARWQREYDKLERRIERCEEQGARNEKAILRWGAIVSTVLTLGLWVLGYIEKIRAWLTTP